MLRSVSKYATFFLLILVFESLAQPNQSASERILQDQYKARREKLIALLDSTSAVVMKASDFRARSNDVNYRYRQESNFFYLTGIEEPNNYLLILPKGVMLDGKRTMALIFTAGERSAREGSSPPQGIHSVLDASRFNEIFTSALGGITTLYISAPDLRFVGDWLNDRPLFLDRDSRKEFEQKHPGVKVKSVGTLLGKLREIKSESEIELIQKSINATTDGIRRAMGVCKPGLWEYELQAEVEYEIIRHGAEYTSFPSIIGSGENSLILHYEKNHRQMKSGELVVIDVGAEYGGYAADITRTIPVSGTFSEAQREVYSIVLSAQRAVIDIIKPGLPFRDLDKKAREVITSAGYGKYIRHGVSHHLGIDAHDASASDTLQAGMVLTVEPGIYIPQKAEALQPEYRGLGIRIEDDVLVTENACEVLSRHLPCQTTEIEELMKR